MAGNYPENVPCKNAIKIPPRAGQAKQSLTTRAIKSIRALEIDFYFE
jgi:hypothetical protein